MENDLLDSELEAFLSGEDSGGIPTQPPSMQDEATLKKPPAKLSAQDDLDIEEFLFEGAPDLKAKSKSTTPTDGFYKNPLEGITTNIFAPITSKPDALEELEKQGVDVTTGGPGAARMKLSLTPQEFHDRVLGDLFPSGYRHTNAGVVVRLPSPGGGTREVLLDEAGFTANDLFDLPDVAIETLGAVGGASALIAAAPEVAAAGFAGIVALSLASAFGSQGAGSVSDFVSSMANAGMDLNNPDDMKLFGNVIKRRGINAGLEFALDMASAGGFKSIRGTTQGLIGPFARHMAKPEQKAAIEAAKRLDLELTPGTATGVQAIQRGEALLSKIPGASGVQEKVRLREESKIQEVVKAITGGLETGETEIAEQAIKTLREQDEIFIRTGQAGIDFQNSLAKSERLQAVNATLDRLGQVKKKIASGDVSEDTVSDLTRLELSSKKNQFDMRQSFLRGESENLMAQLPKEEQRFATTLATRAEANKLLSERVKRTKVTKEVTKPDGSGAPAVVTEKKELVPLGVEPSRQINLAKVLLKLDQKTDIRELRYLRDIINNMISSPEMFPGFSKARLEHLAVAVTADIKNSVKMAPNAELRQALAEELAHFSGNVDKFKTTTVKKFMAEPGKPGYVKPKRMTTQLIRDGDMAGLKELEDVLGKYSPTMRLARRSFVNSMLEGSRLGTLKGGHIDAELLSKQFDKLSLEQKQFVFAGGHGEVSDLVKLLGGAQSKIIDASILRDIGAGDKPIKDIILDAMKREEEIASEFERGIFNPIVRGEMKPDNLKPEQFIRFVLERQSTRNIKLLLSRLPEKQREDIATRAAVHLLDSSVTGNISQFQQMQLREGFPVAGTELESVMFRRKGLGPDSKSRIERLKLVLGEERYNILKDLAVVESARARSRSEAKQAGSLVAGTILSNFFSGGGLKAGVETIKFKIAASLLNFPPTRKWLSSQLLLPDVTNRERAFSVVLPKIAELIGSEFGEDSHVFQNTMDFFENDAPKLLGISKGDKKNEKK